MEIIMYIIALTVSNPEIANVYEVYHFPFEPGAMQACHKKADELNAKMNRDYFAGCGVKEIKIE